jgi:integrase
MAPKPLTVSDAASRAQGLLWAGQSTATGSFRKLSRIASIVGPSLSLDAFDNIVVDKVVTTLQAGGASDATVNRYLSTVSAFLTFCKRRGFRTTALPEIDWRSEDDGRIRWITYDEEAELLSLMPEPFSSVVYLAIRTGMRCGELLSLKADQVEPAWCHLWKTKNGHSRSVPLSQGLYATLAPLVASGEMPSYRRLNMQWDKARKAMGLLGDPTFVFHACRHTYATRSIQAGVNPVVLQKLMGHKTIQTTLRYAHVDDRTLSDAALGALAFHDERGGQGRGTKALNPPPPKLSGASRTAVFRHSEAIRCAPYVTETPRPRFLFRLGPPSLLPPFLVTDTAA